ncbi:uncharacterized protein LOC141630401 [Silene latifolia]|uniref:uncharacterized protein LOC141630401 n=1 Tax=Silene latifolia TaxID=37657 RepID=UPI003D774D74
MPLFDGTTDPFDHMSQYKQKMMTVTAVGQVKEACMCKEFGSTLTEPTLQCFQVAGSHKNMQETCSESSREQEKPLGNTTPDSTMREFDVSTAVEAFRRGLHHDSDMYKQLTMHPYHSFEAVQEKAAAAIRLEEDILARASLPNTPSVSSTSAVDKSARKQSTSKRDERYRSYGRGVNRVEENQQLPTLAEYGFTTGIRGILKALREMGDGVRWPKPLIERQAWRKDSKKKCEFHRDIGHNTEDCYTLRREIMRLFE